MGDRRCTLACARLLGSVGVGYMVSVQVVYIVRVCHGMEGDYSRRSHYAQVYVRAPKGAVRT